jgi:hypothetical protein
MASMRKINKYRINYFGFFSAIKTKRGKNVFEKQFSFCLVIFRATRTQVSVSFDLECQAPGKVTVGK